MDNSQPYSYNYALDSIFEFPCMLDYNNEKICNLEFEFMER